MVRGFAVQFNWIFILIAGALILAFFFGFSMKQRSLSAEKLSITLSGDLEGILTSAVVSTGTAQELPVPSGGVAFECSGGCDCRFRVGRASRSFGDMVVFASGLIEDKGVVWSFPWSVPYRVTNFLFVTSRENKYYFVRMPGDYVGEALLSEVLEKIPSLINYEVVSDVDVSSLVDEGYGSVRFVFFNLNAQDYSLDSSFEDSEVSAVSFDSSFVRFFAKPDDEVVFVMLDQFGYVGVPMVFAGIFSFDDVMYGCGLRSALSKLGSVSFILAERAKKLQSLASAADRPCIYSSAISTLAEQNVIASAGDINSVGRLSAAISLLDRANRDALQRSCPELF